MITDIRGDKMRIYGILECFSIKLPKLGPQRRPGAEDKRIRKKRKKAIQCAAFPYDGKKRLRNYEFDLRNKMKIVYVIK